MDHDSHFARYFAVMNFFIFSMLLLVLAANVLLLFVGWEGVGVASYLLIGFWYDRPAAAKAAKKAFVVNRIGERIGKTSTCASSPREEEAQVLVVSSMLLLGFSQNFENFSCLIWCLHGYSLKSGW
jgi:NADH-quinone oxidoreductase subunit L